MISMCAGQGRDVVGALQGHPRRSDVAARLVELDPRNVAVARRLASESGLSGIDIVAGDASTTSAYAGAVPADLILVCGLLGNLRFAEVRGALSHLPSLSSDGAVVIWTYHRLPPDRTPSVRQWFREVGYNEIAFEASPLGPEVVGVDRLAAQPTLFQEGVTIFEFVGYDQLDYKNLPTHCR